MVQLQLCQLLVLKQEQTKMDAENLSRCLGPIFLADEGETDVKVLMRKTPLNNSVIHLLIQEFPQMIEAMQGTPLRKATPSPTRTPPLHESPRAPASTSEDRRGREREDDRRKNFPRLKSRSRSRKRKNQVKTL